ncbi:hypothetical protein [Lacrimispora sphenoides]|uniref:Uncharacterized protein n=1 Tax=Lacrimispora sphenoides JCM 1415 TaxID=1297793 RepID=A0ABY1C2H7_9FIRM|nr:hypothetical protein [Lacrimispora sphenoides]SET56974.1 hypothetical protein SAMN02745906_0423 [[Clostridium] sphenoides JCM 1415]SUY49815.1 Uncharacterised protein [Lacrimispora sphenoides]
MVEYDDEQIIAVKKQMKALQTANIKEQGIYIGEEYFKFQSVHIFDNVSIYLPESFIEMPDKIRKMKYPSDNRPDVIKTNLNTNINFAFNWLENLNCINQGEELSGQIKDVLIKTNPSFVFYEDRNGKTYSGNIIKMFDFKSYGIDEQMYNMMCTISFHGGILHGIFNCLDRDSEDWKEVAWQVFQTSMESEQSSDS